MAIVTRNGRAYAYRSVRRNGKVTSEYRGSGELAAVIALLDDEDRQERDWERAERRAEREATEAAEQPVVDYFEPVEDLTRAALFAAGFHQHERQWRLRRERRNER